MQDDYSWFHLTHYVNCIIAIDFDLVANVLPCSVVAAIH